MVPAFIALKYMLSQTGSVWAQVDTQGLGGLGFTQTGTTPPTHDKNNYGDFIPFVQPADIRIQGEIHYNSRKLSKQGLNNGRLIDAGSVLMVCIGGSIGKSAPSLHDVSCNQQINVITPLAKIAPLSLQIIFQSPYFQMTLWSRASGGTTPMVNKTKWESILAPLPPLPEQKAIVAKVEKTSHSLRSNGNSNYRQPNSCQTTDAGGVKRSLFTKQCRIKTNSNVRWVLPTERVQATVLFLKWWVKPTLYDDMQIKREWVKSLSPGYKPSSTRAEINHPAQKLKGLVFTLTLYFMASPRGFEPLLPP